MESKFNVVYIGLQEGVSGEEFIEKFCSKFGISEQKAQKIVASKKDVIIKKEMIEKMANRYAEAFKACGMKVRLDNTSTIPSQEVESNSSKLSSNSSPEAFSEDTQNMTAPLKKETSVVKNPYATPASKLDLEAEHDYYEPKLFTFTGRIGRLRYLAYSMVSVFSLVLFFSLLTVLITFINQDYVPMFTVSIGAFVYLFMFVLSIMYAKRRLNDLNRSGWWFLLFLVPIANLLLTLYIIFFPGSSENNDYGPMPIENSLIVKIFGLVFPVLFIVSIVFMIPTYIEMFSQF